MKKKTIIPIILIVISLVLAVLGYIILPDQVVTQFSIGSTSNTTSPKLVAILIPVALGCGGGAMCFFAKDDERTSKKGLIVSVVGLALGAFMIAVNSFAK